MKINRNQLFMTKNFKNRILYLWEKRLLRFSFETEKSQMLKRVLNFHDIE